VKLLLSRLQHLQDNTKLEIHPESTPLDEPENEDSQIKWSTSNK
jgi:hypothetical protein